MDDSRKRRRGIRPGREERKRGEREDSPTHQTLSATSVRVRAPVCQLSAAGSDTPAECGRVQTRILNGMGAGARYPDFTIADHAQGVTFYWEHLGMLADPGYRAPMGGEARRVPGVRNRASRGRRRSGRNADRNPRRPGRRLDAAAIASVIDGVILG